MTNPRRQYLKRKNRYQRFLEKQNRAFNAIVLQKLFVLTGGLGTAAFFFFTKNYPFSGGILALAVFLLIYLEIKHLGVIQRKKYAVTLREINVQSLKRMDGEWTSFPDSGTDFRDENHPYSGDLDLFGQGSLFQMINTTGTYFGRQKLKQVLENPPESTEKIRQKQDAIAELAKNLEWRQRLMAEAAVNPKISKDPNPLFGWAKQINRFFLKPEVVFFLRGLPALTITLIGLSYFTALVSYQWPLLLVGIQLLILLPGGKQRARNFATVYQYKDNIKVYQKMFQRLEEKRFHSSYLLVLQQNLQNCQQEPVYRQINNLEKIADAIANQYNFFYLIINAVTLWDYQCLIALERWKEKSGVFLENWLDILGEVEALSSLAVIGHAHPTWAVPQILENPSVYIAQDLGHPLLTEKRVCNDLKINHPTGILLITGSNMSGKSTFLRTAGINLVLAYAGAPVCARNFRASLMRICTCMRVSDNLEKNISTFYAEILRIKMIVTAASGKELVFFLLDEIFKGTNSADRHTGAKILIKKMSEKDAIGLVSTHDLELGELEAEMTGKIKNYHFQESYQNDQISFDYLLRPGISTTRNALFLIRSAGINFEKT